MKKPLQLAAFAFAFLYSLTSLASIESKFEALKNSAEDFQPEGAVCEQVARLDVAEKYPSPAYEVTTGIVYGNGHQTIGELDVVVLRKSDGKAVLVAEVKCWKNLSRAHTKAMNQRERFLKTVAQMPNGIRFYKKTETYAPAQFAGVNDFISIAQLGAKSFGFEQDLDYTLEDMKKLRLKLLKCQESGLCRAPL